MVFNQRYIQCAINRVTVDMRNRIAIIMSEI